MAFLKCFLSDGCEALTPIIFAHVFGTDYFHHQPSFPFFFKREYCLAPLQICFYFPKELNVYFVQIFNFVHVLSS